MQQSRASSLSIIRSTKMLAKLRAWKASQDVKECKDGQTSINFREEYHRALRTKSYADCFKKAQLLASQTSINLNNSTFSEILLEPDQETIPSLLESSTISRTPEFRNLMLSFFEISAEASHICTHLIKCINQIHSNYKFIQRALDINDDGETLENFELIILELNSFILSTNPFSNLENHDFKLINDKYSSVLQQLRSMRKRVGRKIKVMKCLKRISEICVIATCGIVAITAMVIASHTLTALSMGAAILSSPFMHFKRKIQRCRISGSNNSLSKVYDQLDIAAKGTYILTRDFDTMSRIVARLHDEIEHNRTMVQFCLDRKEDKFCLKILKELKKSDFGFMKLVEELEEHVFLCLVTINKARALVIQEMKKSCV